MRTKEELDRLRERSIALRREGKSRREIKAILGPMSNMTLNDFLRGVPAPDWTRRPNAKDEVRIMARRLRNLGLDYEEIAARLGVSKSSVSLWVRDLPRPARLSVEECRKRSAEGSRRYWEAERPARKNVGDGYRGCLRIDVRRSGDLYRRIEGWVGGAMLATA